MNEEQASVCRLKGQGLAPGSCRVAVEDGQALACQATLRYEEGEWQRLISAVHLSRPENYLSIYQSGCNPSCRKCHSWSFSQVKTGEWFRPLDILNYASLYDEVVSLREPRERATAWHAHETCRCCGSCVLTGQRSRACPGVLDPEAIRVSPQGLGPARNIVAFTGGDLTCRPEFYANCARLIKSHTRLHLLLETNGYGLTPENLDSFKDSGVDAFWLDIKAHDPEKHRWLTGRTNETILKLPAEMLRRSFVLEVLSLFIPNLVETEDLEQTARLLAGVDPDIPFTLLAFFPEYQMKDFRAPTAGEMVRAYARVRAAGLTRVRLSNVGVFAPTEEDRDYLAAHVDAGGY